MNDDIGRLLISCPDRPGVVAAVSHFLFDRGANIIHSDQHSTEHGGGTFFMRTEFQLADLANSRDLEHAFKAVAGPFGMPCPLSCPPPPKPFAAFASPPHPTP